MTEKLFLGNSSQVALTDLPSLTHTGLKELITTEKCGCPFSFNILQMDPGGQVAEQSHEAQHAIYVINGICRILIGEEWITLSQGGYTYIPPNVTHAFDADSEQGGEVLILKL